MLTKCLLLIHQSNQIVYYVYQSVFYLYLFIFFNFITLLDIHISCFGLSVQNEIGFLLELFTRVT